MSGLRQILFASLLMLQCNLFAQELIKIDFGFEICNLRGAGAVSATTFVLGGYCVRNDSLQHQGLIVKINAQGSVLGQLEVGNVQDDNIQSLIVQPELNLVICTGERIVPGGKKGMIIACDTNLNLLWERTVALPGIDVSFKSVAVYAGNIYAFGMVVPLVAPVATGAYYIYICSIMGDSLHSASGNVYGFDVGNAIYPTGNPNLPLIVAGDAIAPGKVEPYHAFVTSENNFTEGENWVQEGLGAGFQAITSGSDNAIYLGGEGYPAGSDTFDFLLAKISAAGMPLWQKWIHTAGTDAIFSLAAISEDRLAFTGYSNGNAPGSPIDAVVGVTDTSGQLLMLQYIENVGVDIGYKIFEAGGKMYVVGTFADGNNNKYGIWGIEKSALVQLKTTIAAPEIKIFPNPFQEKVTITVTHATAPFRLILSNAVGKVLLVQEVEAAGNVFTFEMPQSLASGIYYLQLQSAGVQFNKKLIFARK